jgi:hypothetical protein
MRPPKAAGTPINLKRRRDWINRFGAYRHPVNVNTIDSWLQQFSEEHRDVAARVLDAIDFVDSQRIASFFRTTLAAMDGWSLNPAQRQGKWRFCPWSTTSGDSAGRMLHDFRLANNLAHRTYDELFINPSDIVRARLGRDDTLVFVNDFIGTGTEVCDAWHDYFAELAAEIGRVYLLVSIASEMGRERVTKETSIQVASGQELCAADNVFAEQCEHFTKDEKEALLSYSKKADKKLPKGFGEMGLVLVFQHRCPNNSMALLHAASNKWEPLFPRNN